MEFLEKILYLLSLFAPIGLFFSFGLCIAWWVWYRHADALQVAYANNLELSEQVEAGREDERDLSARALALLSSEKSKWGVALRDRGSEFDRLREDLEQSEKQLASVEGDLEARTAELEQLRGELKSQQEMTLKLESEIGGAKQEGLGFGGDLAGREDELKEADRLGVIAADTSDLDADFAGEKVRQDEKLGLVFIEKPALVDDLKRIKGVAKVLEKRLHEFGVYRFKQISMWDEAQIAEFSDRLSFPDRIKRDNWQQQSEEFYRESRNE